MIKKGSHMAKIISVLKQARGKARTTRELAAKMEMDDHSMVGVVIGRMVKRGLVCRDGSNRWCTITGALRVGWVLTDAGREVKPA